MAKCKICKEKFNPKQKGQFVCSYECAFAYVKKQREKKQKKEWNERKKELKPKVKSKEYKANLQAEINKLARKIDSHFGYLCIDCNKPYGKQIDAAHFHNKGGHSNITYNLHNLHSARSYCNKYDSQHKVGYEIGLKQRYGIEYLNLVGELPIKYDNIGLKEFEIVEALKTVRKLNREFENHIDKMGVNGKEVREYFNNLIGIY